MRNRIHVSCRCSCGAASKADKGNTPYFASEAAKMGICRSTILDGTPYIA